MPADHSELLEKYLAELTRAATIGPILDLACGGGRNGCYLLANHITTVFADINKPGLELIDSTLSAKQRALAGFWPVDFEREHAEPLRQKCFGGIIVFRYLHRALMEGIKEAIAPGGIVIYETFTVDQAELGRPKNPDYLLRHDELPEIFRHWNTLHYFEGTLRQVTGNRPVAIAQIVAIKPD